MVANNAVKMQVRKSDIAIPTRKGNPISWRSSVGLIDGCRKSHILGNEYKHTSLSLLIQNYPRKHSNVAICIITSIALRSMLITILCLRWQLHVKSLGIRELTVTRLSHIHATKIKFFRYRFLNILSRILGFFACQKQYCQCHAYKHHIQKNIPLK